MVFSLSGTRDVCIDVLEWDPRKQNQNTHKIEQDKSWFLKMHIAKHYQNLEFCWIIYCFARLLLPSTPLCKLIRVGKHTGHKMVFSLSGIRDVFIDVLEWDPRKQNQNTHKMVFSCSGTRDVFIDVLEQDPRKQNQNTHKIEQDKSWFLKNIHILKPFSLSPWASFFLMRIAQFPNWSTQNLWDDKAYSSLNFMKFRNLIRQISLHDAYLQNPRTAP